MRQLEGFLLASELLSFSRASEEMHITQSAFSQLIRELEAQLGVQLFNRTTRQVSLTAAGDAMRSKMKRGLHEIENACDEAQAIARVDRGHIRLGTLSSLAVSIVIRTLMRLRVDFPGITVSMSEGANDMLVELVASGDTDLSVCTDVGPAPGLAFEALFDDELMLVTKAGSALARRRSPDWDALIDEPLVLTARGTSTRTAVSTALTAYGIVKPADYEVSGMATSMALVRAGFGSTFISRVALRDMDTAGLAIVRMRNPARRRMGVYRRADRVPSPASLQFIELVRAQVAEAVQF